MQRKDFPRRKELRQEEAKERNENKRSDKKQLEWLDTMDFAAKKERVKIAERMEAAK